MNSKRALSVSLLSLLCLSSQAVAQPAEHARQSCFFSQQFDNWKAADAKTMYIHVRPNRYYRLDMSAPCHALMQPGAFLITRLRGSSTICSALDWELHVATSWHGIPQACIVKKMTELTPAEVAKLPPKVKP
ncbi:MAG: hypothetical protein KGO02_17595 [Alphaproteobacteria bacterium]|nr:hypothetical protein [Alphaproteobacteria bacterium]